MAATLQCDKTIDMRWMPKDCDGQIKMGFNIIANAFKSKVKALEEDLITANKERAELEEKMAAQQSKLMKLEREHVESTILQSRLVEVEERLIEKTAELENSISEHRKREQDLLSDNRRLAEHVRIYKKKAQQLEEFRRVVVESIKKEDEPTYYDVGSDKLITQTYSMNRQRNLQSSTNDALIMTQPSNTHDVSEGRQLFRHARAKLSVDQYEKFLESVRRLNAHTISTEEAITEIEKICGYEHAYILDEFKNLIIHKGQQPHTSSITTQNILLSPVSPQVC